MGFDNSKPNKKNQGNDNLINKSNKKDELGEEFILEDWEVYNDKNKNIDNTIKFDKDLLISEADRDPLKDYEEKKLLGEGSMEKFF